MVKTGTVREEKLSPAAPRPLTRRDRVATWLQRAGLHTVLRNLPKQKVLLVLNYHRIGSAADAEYDPDIFSATPEELDDQVRFLKEQLDFVDLNGALELLSGARTWRGPRALITFDDGYRDNYDAAYPILKSHNVSGVFFLPTAFIGTNRLPWWDLVAYIVRHARSPVLRLGAPFHLELDFRPETFDVSLQKLLKAYKSSNANSEQFLRALEEAAKVDRPNGHRERLFLSWEEASAMVAGGMSIGSHTHSHEILSTLSGEEQWRELSESREMIRRYTGYDPISVAYPVGKKSSFSGETQKYAQAAGYRAAFSFYGGVNRPHHPNRLDIQRCGVDRPLRERLRLQILSGTVFRKFWP